VNPDADVAVVLAGVLGAFGSYDAVVDVAEGSARLRELLAGAACLVVLDNVWNVEVLRAVAVPAGCRLLVTTRSREALFTDSAVYPVGRLDDPTARHVLANYAGCPVARLPAVADEAVARCGGLALALALVGGMVGEGRRWGSVVERLRRADQARLAGQFPDYPHPDLLAALDVSVRTLGVAEAVRFRELAVFDGRGPVPVGVAARLWAATAGLEDLDADDLLSVFGQRSLVELSSSGETFTLHDLLFDYTRNSLGTQRLAELHGQLAHAFLDRWGGLRAALPALRDVAVLADTDRYAVDSAIFHLLAAGLPDTVDAVLTAEWPTGAERADNVWYTVHEDLGRTDGYLADVRAARRATETPSTAKTDALRRQILYALIIGSVSSIAANIPPALLTRLLQENLWPPQRALAYALATPDPSSKAAALRRLAPHLPADQQRDILALALSAATAIDDPSSRAEALRELAPHLPADQQRDILAQALTVGSLVSRSSVVGVLLAIVKTDAVDTGAGTSLIASLRWWP
jgi:hypothetical protein